MCSLKIIKNVEEITKTLALSEDPSIYIQNPSVTDPTLAPEGKSALYILAPVPNNFSGVNWDEKQKAFRDAVLKIVEKKTGFKDLESHIEVEKSFHQSSGKKTCWSIKERHLTLDISSLK